MSETDRRLKDHLNTNQSSQERMCLEILSVCAGYSNIVPRLPNGGPDGARDLQAVWNGITCFGAVGFVANASDHSQHRTKARAKFRRDIKAAFNAYKSEYGNILEAFVFFTNVGFTPTITQELKSEAHKMGVSYCDIFDRERIRAALDSSKGYAIRYRYLDIPLSDAEQKDFFTTFGDVIGKMVATGISGLDKSTKRIQFLLEAQMFVDSITTCVRLNTCIKNIDSVKYIFQTGFSLLTNSEGLLAFDYGGGGEVVGDSLDRIEYFDYAFAWLLPDTEQHKRFSNILTRHEKEGVVSDDTFLILSSHGAFDSDATNITFRSGLNPFIERFHPYFRLIEANHSSVIFDCNRQIAEHIENITIFANGYKILCINKSDIRVESSDFGRFRLPAGVRHIEAGADFVTIRPRGDVSCFTIDFISETPDRFDWGSA